MIQIKEFKLSNSLPNDDRINQWIEENQETARVIDVHFASGLAFVIYEKLTTPAKSPAIQIKN